MVHPDLFVILLGGVSHKQSVLWSSVRVAQSVPQGGKLAVVVVEVQVVNSVASSSVHHRVIGNIVSVVDHDGPEVDKGEQQQVRHLVQRQEHRIQVVWQRLREAVHRMEGVGSKWSANNPLVVRFMQTLVHGGPVQPAVEEVDAAVGEENEHGELQPEHLPSTGLFGNVEIQLGEAVQLQEEERDGERHHNGDSGHGLPELQGDLVLQVSGMVEDLLVENENVGRRRHEKIQEPAEDGGDDKKREELSEHIASRKERHVGVFGKRQVDGRHLAVDFIFSLVVADDFGQVGHGRRQVPRGGDGRVVQDWRLELFQEELGHGSVFREGPGIGFIQEESVCDFKDDIHVERDVSCYRYGRTREGIYCKTFFSFVLRFVSIMQVVYIALV